MLDVSHSNASQIASPVASTKSATESVLSKILSQNSNTAMAQSAAAMHVAETSQSGQGVEYVLAVDELWNDSKTVCLLVKELRDGVVFEVGSGRQGRRAHLVVQVSNIGTQSAMVAVQCCGENLEPLEVCLHGTLTPTPDRQARNMIPGGTKSQRIGRCRPQEPEMPWKFSYEWSDDLTELQVPCDAVNLGHDLGRSAGGGWQALD